MTLRISTASALLSVGLLTACNPPASDKAETSTTTVTTVVTPSASTPALATSEPISCATEIGAAAAEKLVNVCRNVSPATHPPCNAANSCAMIEDEIARSCALFDDNEPMAGCGPAPKSSQAAAAVVTRYYSALNASDFDTAWRQWGEDGQPNQTRDTFQAGFAHTQSTRVTIGKLEPAEGGAGSIYQTVPVTVDAMLDNGQRQRFTGDYVVRRVNGVDGASAEQLRWHIDSARLKAVTPG
ncbi:hypothetical protein ABI_15660 [Asticcacaulis biprosthecium C19]|uniref:Lipoprotein n=1 Tax=Asticcacaulis biprosthecium C19 TaxID=715226 RepID=F4QJE3_9CAUL|nr:hypothetical protein [Asticcacaulis biprosthecium]EGF93126.1 hypothetical protein ABI_15660 [Asticcacaulis biprosthecium C19]